MTWGIPVSLYLFFAGASAGSFALALTFAVLEGSKRFGELAQRGSALKKSGFILAPILLVVGAILLLIDASAGLTRPLSYLGVFGNAGSAMTWGSWIILLNLVAQVVAVVLAVRKKELSASAKRAWAIVGLVLAAALAIYTAILLGVVEPSPLWNSAALVILFVLSAVLSGVALAAILGLILDREGTTEALRALRGPILGAELAEIVTLVAHLAVTAARGDAGALSVASLVSGDYAAAFWLGIVIVGFAVPIVLEALPSVRAGKGVGALFAAFTATAVGALFLRVVIIGAAQFAFVSAF